MIIFILLLPDNPMGPNLLVQTVLLIDPKVQGDMCIFGNITIILTKGRVI